MKKLKPKIYLNYEVSLVQKSLETSHPISVDVNNPKEINYIFDAISYDKVINLVKLKLMPIVLLYRFLNFQILKPYGRIINFEIDS